MIEALSYAEAKRQGNTLYNELFSDPVKQTCHVAKK